jgi:hypothetical protein
MFERCANWTERNTLRAIYYALAGIVSALAVAIGIAVGSSVAHGADATVSWTNPTQNTDGTAIPAAGAGSLTGTRVEWGTCSGGLFGVKAGETVVPAPAASGVLPGFSPGTTVCFRAFARNTFGVESLESNTTAKTFPAPTPKPPVIVTVSGLVWELKTHPVNGPYLARVVGIIVAGKPCNGLAPQYAENLFAVNHADVTFSRNVPAGATLVAQCGVS